MGAMFSQQAQDQKRFVIYVQSFPNFTEITGAWQALTSTLPNQEVEGSKVCPLLTRHGAVSSY
jgi:hypothetical protein